VLFKITENDDNIVGPYSIFTAPCVCIVRTMLSQDYRLSVHLFVCIMSKRRMQGYKKGQFRPISLFMSKMIQD